MITLPSQMYASSLGLDNSERDTLPLQNTAEDGGVRLIAVNTRPGKLAKLQRIVTGVESKKNENLKSTFKKFIRDMGTEFGPVIADMAQRNTGLSGVHEMSRKKGSAMLSACKVLSTRFSRPVLEAMDARIARAGGDAMNNALIAAGLRPTAYDEATMHRLQGMASDLARRRAVFAVHEEPDPRNPKVDVGDIHRQACADIADICRLLPSPASGVVSHVLDSLAAQIRSKEKFPPTGGEAQEMVKEHLAIFDKGAAELTASQMRHLEEQEQRLQQYELRRNQAWNLDSPKCNAESEPHAGSRSERS